MVYKSLKDIAIITMGQSPDSSSYNGDRVGMPFFQGNADFGELYPTERIWCNAPKKIANPNDILISVRAPIGALNMANKECCIGRGLAAITIKDPAERNYVYHLLKAKTQELNSKGTGSTFKAIGKSVLEDVQIPQISKSEQELCMKTMDLLESIIRERQSQLTHLDELVKARFVEMYFEWNCQEKPLGDYLDDITYGFTNPMPDAQDGPWKITAKDVVDGRINFDTARKTTKESFDALTSKSKPVIGDVLLTKDGTLGRTAIVEEEGICVNQSVAVLRCNNQVVPRFLSLLLQLPEYQREMTKNSGGGTIKHIYITKVDKMLVRIPTIDKQENFIRFVEQVDKSKVAVQKSLDETQLLFDCLMQNYFG